MARGTAEVAHEALLREWPRLRGWLEADAEGRRLHRHLTLAGQDWDGAGRNTSGELYRGGRLSSTPGRRSTGEELDRLEREFLESSGRLGE